MDIKYIMKIIKEFVKHNKLLTLGSIITLMICITYILTSRLPELFIGGELLFNFFYNLSLAYLASFLFYIIQSYIPEQKRKEEIAKEELPKRYVNQRLIQLFTISILELFSQILSNRSNKNISTNEESNYELVFNSTVFRNASNNILLNSPGFMCSLTGTLSWGQSIINELNTIEKRGKKILGNSSLKIPYEIYQSIFYLMEDCYVIPCMKNNIIKVLNTSPNSNNKLSDCLPVYMSAKGETDDDLLFFHLHRLIKWVNTEYKEIKDQDGKSKIFNIPLKSYLNR